MATDRDPISVLNRDEAWKLLARRSVGRLAVSVSGQPDIFPVNFHADETSIVFRTAPGSKLLDVTINMAVAFETDGYDTDEAWSVVVKGPWPAVLDSDGQADLRSYRSHRSDWTTIPIRARTRV